MKKKPDRMRKKLNALGPGGSPGERLGGEGNLAKKTIKKGSGSGRGYFSTGWGVSKRRLRNRNLLRRKREKGVNQIITRESMEK